MRFVKDHFDEYRESTIGGKCLHQLELVAVVAHNACIAAFLAQTVTLDDNTIVKFEIW